MKIKGLLFFLGMAVGFLGYAVAEEQPSQIELRDDGIYENGLWLAPLPAASEAEKPELFMPDMWFTYGTTFNSGSGYSQGTTYLANSFDPAYFGQSYPFNITEVRARIWNNSGATDQVQFSIYPGTSTTPVYTSPLINVPTGSSTWLNHPLTSPVPISSGTFMVSFIYYGTNYTYLWYNSVTAPNGHGYSRAVTSPTWTWLNTRDWSIGAYVISGGPTNADVYVQTPLLTGTQPAPTQVWTGATYTPYDTVGNNGQDIANTVTTECKIDGIITWQSISSLTMGAKAQNNFAALTWTANLKPGTIHNRRDTTYAASPTDPDLTNNKVATSYTAVYDGETVSIDSPPPGVVVGNTYPIQATFKNNSPTGAATFAVVCSLGTSPKIVGFQTVTNLPAGASTQVTFFNWTVPPGTSWPLTVVCQMNGDINTSNNIKSIICGTITDMQMKPSSLFLTGNLTGLGAGQVWCGTVYTPRDTVFNNGPATGGTITTLSFFDASPPLTGSAIPLLAPGAQQEVSFPTWTASRIPNTAHSRRDTTYAALPPDPDLTNNKRTAAYTALYDGQTVSIDDPPANPWCGAIYAPKAMVKNNSGAGAADFSVTCTITGGYSSTKNVTNLAAGASIQVTFDNWTASRVPNTSYTVTTTCQTTGDNNTANNTQTKTITTIYDGQTVSIDDPPAQVWCGSTRTPKATVKNNSALGAATFTVTCTITGGYSSTKTVSNLAAGATIQVTFDSWLVSRSPNTAYTVTTTCQTTGDNNTANNTQTSTTTSVYDGQTVSIDNPPVNSWCGADYQPQATVKNNSPEGAADFSVTCTITGGYSNTQNVSNLTAGSTRQISFASWIASNVPNTSYTVMVTCLTTGDVNAANNVQTRTITTVYDGETVDIDAPPDTVMTGTNYTPEATVKNSSARGYADFSVTCTITPGGYTSTRNLTGLAAGATTQVLFAGWTSPLAASVTYTMTVTCQTTGDNNTPNNTITKTIFAYGDVGAFEAHYPIDEVYVDTDIYPTVMLRNFTGGTTEGFDVTIQAEDEAGGVVYEDITAAASMTPNQDREFYATAAWHTPSEVGKHFILHAFTQLPGDCKPTNDQTDWEVVTVAKPGSDVRPKSIDSPNSASSGAVYTPKATVENPGTNSATFWTFCTIDAGLFKAAYIDSILVDNLSSGANQPLIFKDWTAEAGSYVLRVITALTGDEHPENDTATLQLTSTGIEETNKLEPKVFSLESSKPNPFYNTTEIRYGIPVTSRINLSIYDITGKLVKTLANGTKNLGFHRVVWNGNDNTGNRLSAGLYFIRFEAKDYTATRKLIFIVR